MKRLFFISLVVALVSVLVFGGCAGGAKQQVAAEFFKGKTITISVTGGPGGGIDLYTRLAVDYLAAETGAKIGVVNESSGGGLVLLNKLFNSTETDGLTLLGAPLGVIFSNYSFDTEGVSYDITKYQYIGAALGGKTGIQVDPKGLYTSIPLIQKATKQLRCSTRSAGTILVASQYAANEILGLNVIVIPGYKQTQDKNLAVLKGEAEMTHNPMQNAMIYEKEGQMKTVLNISAERSKFFPDVPALGDYKKLTDADKLLLTPLHDDGYMLAAPPNIDKDKLEFLRKALVKVYENKDFQAAAVKAAGMWAGYMTGEELKKLASDLVAGKPKFQSVYKQLEDKYLKK